MNAFPAFVPLAGVRVVVAGEGEAADAKARLFGGSPAELVRLSPEEAMSPAAYVGVRLAFIALPEPDAPAAARAAREAGAWVNVVDQPALCDFHTPSIVDRGAVVGAIGTGGRAPLLASRLRTEWEARWPTRLGAVAELLSQMRAPVRDRFEDMRSRRVALLRVLDGPAGDAALAGDVDAAERLAQESLGDAAPLNGKLVRIEAPPDPEDLTLRDLRVLARADRLIAPADMHPAILAHVRRDAVRSHHAAAAAVTAWVESGETVVVLGTP